jgi:hypothetical protein
LPEVISRDSKLIMQDIDIKKAGPLMTPSRLLDNYWYEHSAISPFYLLCSFQIFLVPHES